MPGGGLLVREKTRGRGKSGRQLGSGQKNGPTAGTKRNTHIKTNTLCY